MNCSICSTNPKAEREQVTCTKIRSLVYKEFPQNEVRLRDAKSFGVQMQLRTDVIKNE